MKREVSVTQSEYKKFLAKFRKVREHESIRRDEFDTTAVANIRGEWVIVGRYFDEFNSYTIYPPADGVYQ